MALLAGLTASILILLLAACARGGPYHPSGPAAREGHGILPPLKAPPSVLGGVPPKQAFELDPSGAFSRTVFVADDQPDIRITVRDITVAPKQPTRPITLPDVALLELRAGRGAVSVAGQTTELTGAKAMAIPAGTAVVLSNGSDQALVVRQYVIEAKR